MPELPEVETIVRTLRPQVLGKTIQRVQVLLPKSVQAGIKRLPLLERAEITSVGRRAKLLLVGLGLATDNRSALTLEQERLQPEAQAGSPAANALPFQPPKPSADSSTLPEGMADADLLLVFHLKMTGSFFVHPAGADPLRHTRVIFDLGTDGRLFFDDTRTFGYCRIMLPRELPDWPFWAALGPEPLGMSARALAAHFAGAFADRRAAVKGLLLNQEIVAGIGNIYADESLFQAGIAPAARACDIERGRLEKLATALQGILRKSIEECGSSIRNYRDALGNAGAFQNSFAVYGRKGQTCARCGTPLEGATIAGRATVFCPRCQR
jgi:formamidopyrimidine-DNA glycosylase